MFERNVGKRNRSLAETFLFLTMLFPILNYAKDTSTKPTWSGKYLHHSGRFEMVIEQWDIDGLSIDITKKNESKIPPYASVVAFLKEPKLAEYRDSREHDCWMSFKRIPVGIIVYDHCGGTGEDVGLYRKQDK